MLLVVAAVIAALGVALVFVYARGAEARAADRYDSVEVLTASQKIAPGESIDDALESGKVQLAHVAKAQLLEGASKDSKSLRGKVALTTIHPGEQLIPAKFGGAGDPLDVAALPIPKGLLTKTEDFNLPLGAFILPGSEVAIFATGVAQKTCLLLPRVAVVAVGTDLSSASEDEADLEETKAPPLTIALSQDDFQALESAKQNGELSVALLNSESKVRPSCPGAGGGNNG
ncbi:Flp pilus assembly protein CpaB [Nocardioides sp. SYSU DS0651]|uniref:Flp pilus assembly protein CpaB n=1 Tax=Nocardioides sp. SYSU DS0651 TaxID=3415955 RepID=UPI003F4B5E05